MVKDSLLKMSQEILQFDERIIFAYAYGSFISGEPFRDIDIGVYAQSSADHPFAISSDLKTVFSLCARREGFDLTADPFDVRILNDAPFTFWGGVFREGVPLLDRDPDLRMDLIESVSRKYRECPGILVEASLS